LLDIQFAAAKVNKYASRESGDTVELVERPTTGFTIVLADGQGSGRNAKILSNLVTSRCVALLKEGVRDGAVARAVSDHLYAYRHGQVSATLNLISADFATRTLVITRNNPEPTYLCCRSENSGNFEIKETILDEPVVPIGIYPRTRPVVREFALEAGLIAVSFSDGISGAGGRYEEKLDLLNALRQILQRPVPQIEAQTLADELLAQAIAQDRQRPQDDMSIIVVTTSQLNTEDGTPLPRRMSVNASLQ
jgi:serine phosphatase RsbU (regulator of sigma subunit)